MKDDTRREFDEAADRPPLTPEQKRETLKRETLERAIVDEGRKASRSRSPFYVGQPADDVRVVAHRTNRRRTAVEFVCASGEYRLELRRDSPKAVREWMAQQTFKPATVTEVRNFYPGCTLIMRHSRGMFRVAEIISEGQDDGKD